MNTAKPPGVAAFFDAATHTWSYVVSDPATLSCAIIDPVLDFDPVSARTATTGADALIRHVQTRGLSLAWILETHVHADHLSAGRYIQQKLGGELAIGQYVTTVQTTFAGLFNPDEAFATDGSQFDRLFADEAVFSLGRLPIRALHTPGHTPACLTYLIGDAAFAGDTLFMPDLGTGRCDFPGGSARQLYRSIRKILALPESTRIFVGHDYPVAGREQLRYETSVAEQRRGNVHVRDGVTEADFIALRQARDAMLELPRLILPSLQVNMRAGGLPAAAANGVRYLKIPLNVL